MVMLWVCFHVHYSCVCVCVCMCSLGRCVSSLKNLLFMLLNWWLEWCEGGAGRSFSSSSAALRSRPPASLTSRIAAVRDASRADNQRSASKDPFETLNKSSTDHSAPLRAKNKSVLSLRCVLHSNLLLLDLSPAFNLFNPLTLSFLPPLSL